MDRWFYTERDAVRDYIKSTSKSLLYRHNKQAIVLRWYIHSNCYLVIIISWQSVYIWMNTNMEFKYFEFIKIIIYSLSLSLSLSQYILVVYPIILLKRFTECMGRQYMRHTLVRIFADDKICRVKISSWRQYMLCGDNMVREYRHKLSPATICVGTTIYVATEVNGTKYLFWFQWLNVIPHCKTLTINIHVDIKKF